MNSLSWFLYIADVVSGLGVGMCAFGTISLLLGGLFTIPGYLCPWDGEHRFEHIKEQKKPYTWLAPRLVIVGITLILISAFIPSKQTMYQIAASEMGEIIVTSDEAKEVFSELKVTVMDQLRAMRSNRDGSVK